MRSRRTTTQAILAAILPPSAAPQAGGRPAFLYVIAGILAIAAIYYLIRILEWDQMNRETPNQDDPMPPRGREEP